jgi:hypothetical protein
VDAEGVLKTEGIGFVNREELAAPDCFGLAWSESRLPHQA